MNEVVNAKEQSLQQALGFMRDRRPLRAEEVCRDYLSSNPGCVDHLRLLAHSLQRQGRLNEAEDTLRFAISMDEGFPQLHEDLGSVLALRSKFDAAIASFERAIRLDPSLPLVQKKLGQALLAAGRAELEQPSSEVQRSRAGQSRARVMT